MNAAAAAAAAAAAVTSPHTVNSFFSSDLVRLALVSLRSADLSLHSLHCSSVVALTLTLTLTPVSGNG